MPVDFYFAIPSRYSYLASTQVGALERDTGCRFRWHAVSTQRVTAAAGMNPFDGAPASGQYDWAYRERDAARWAELYGVPFREPRGRLDYDPELVARAATAGALLGQAEPYARRLFAAMFAENRTRLDAHGMTELAMRCGMDPARFADSLDDAATAHSLEERVAAAVGAGVFGVPSFVVDGRVYWGNDRLPLLRHHLETRRQT